jgi:hypothetical protein
MGVMLVECGCDQLFLWVQIDIRVRLTADIATTRARMAAIDTHTPVVSVIVFVPSTVQILCPEKQLRVTSVLSLAGRDMPHCHPAKYG